MFLDAVLPPWGFRGIQAADLSGWSPEHPSPAFDSFLADIGAVVGASHPGPSPLSPTTGMLPEGRPSQMRKKREPIENVRSLIKAENDGGGEGRAVADQILAREFRITRNDGGEKSREAYLDWVADPNRPKVLRSLTNECLVPAAEMISVAATCVVRSIVEVDGVRYRNMHVFEWLDEFWKCAAWQVTKLD